ncbi:MAG: PQQ-binding-like beta-propeller repeat protein [Pirellulaceae bacterium]|nr:PQQ-binding-like beta-propeller repeat protein [Pirellulaceae bacterium]
MFTKSQLLSFAQRLLRGVLVAGGLAMQPVMADWPAHRANPQRTNFGEQEITATAWEPLWYQPVLGSPTPAWPAPAKASLWNKLSSLEPRMTDDSGDIPLIARDAQGAHHVLVTSSANDRLISLAPTTGEIEWQYVMRAPIRYAPSIVDGIAYLGADDGMVRAVNLTDGAEVWSVHVGPAMPAIIGNNRLISPHPVRTSVLADAQFVYASAGLFPSQGVYLVALDRATGKVHWRRNTTKSPQGYLLATEGNLLYVPTGRATPFAIRRDNGEFATELPSPGGNFCMLTEQAFFSGPGNDGSVQARPSATDAKMLTFAGRLIVAGAKRIWTANGKQLTCVDAEVLNIGEMTPQWSLDCNLKGTMIGAGSNEKPILFIAQGPKIEIRNGSDGTLLNELLLPNVDDAIQYLAVSSAAKNMPETLVATTQSGAIYAWQGATGDAHDGSFTEPTTSTLALAERTSATQKRSPKLAQRVAAVLEQLPVARGWILLMGDDDGDLARSIVTNSEFNVLSLVAQQMIASRLHTQFQDEQIYGSRVSVWLQPDNAPFPIAPGLFNAVIEGASSKRNDAELMTMLVDKIGVLSRVGSDKLQIKSALVNSGAWRHQYADPTNQADSRDPYVGSASAFRLQWFGGVGPSRMPDRHLRGPAPLAAGAVLVMQGDGLLIGVDPANGVERWQRELPVGAMRYVTPLDAGYATLSEQGETLSVAAGVELWQINAYTGGLLTKTNVPPSGIETVWGYVAQFGDSIYATRMKPTAPRTAQDTPTRYTFVNNDYNSERPLVTARAVSKLDGSGAMLWSYEGQGVIAHGSLAVDEERQRMIFVEGRSAACIDHATDQVPLATIMEEAQLVCLNTETGAVAWEQPLVWPEASNMMYGQLAGDKVVLTTSESEEDKANYAMRVWSLKDGAPIWQAKHRHVRSGLFHGEQVHHPVLLSQADGTQLLVAEPYLYDLRNGNRVVPEGAAEDWALVRPGHSCGTLTGTGHFLFFRASNPTLLDLSRPGGKAFTALAPNRAGCWINMIPAAGRLLIPEASASCICNYSIQTSMAFAPISEAERESALPTLEEVLVEGE